MQFACNAYCFPHDSIEANARAAAEAGFDGIEPAVDEGARTDEAALETMRDAAAEHDVEIPSVIGGSWAALASDDDETREAAIAATEDLIDAAAWLGADTVLVVPGEVDRETRYDIAHKHALESVRALAPTAAEAGVDLAVENVWNDFLYSPLEFRDFVDAAATQGPVGAYFDVGNIARYGYPTHWIEILGDRLTAVHVKDYDAVVDTGNGFTYPLAGSIDWPAVAEALDGVGYDGWITPEIGPYTAMPERTLPNILADLQAIFD